MYIITSQPPVSYVVMNSGKPVPADKKCELCREENQTHIEAANVIFALTDALQQLRIKVLRLQHENAELRRQLDKQNKLDRNA